MTSPTSRSRISPAISASVAVDGHVTTALAITSPTVATAAIEGLLFAWMPDVFAARAGFRPLVPSGVRAALLVAPSPAHRTGYRRPGDRAGCRPRPPVA